MTRQPCRGRGIKLVDDREISSLTNNGTDLRGLILDFDDPLLVVIVDPVDQQCERVHTSLVR